MIKGAVFAQQIIVNDFKNENPVRSGHPTGNSSLFRTTAGCLLGDCISGKAPEGQPERNHCGHLGRSWSSSILGAKDGAGGAGMLLPCRLGQEAGGKYSVTSTTGVMGPLGPLGTRPALCSWKNDAFPRCGTFGPRRFRTLVATKLLHSLVACFGLAGHRVSFW